MTTILIFIFIFWFCVVILVIASIRNDVVLRVRLAFIDDGALYPIAYRKLPTYNEMHFHPKHYGRWTKAHWIKYVEANHVN